MAIVFDGPNLTITLDSIATNPTQTAVEVYSRWKDWVKLADNAKFLPAFDLSVGGNPTTDVQALDAYIFLNNTIGWRIRPPEETGELLLEGNLFGNNPALPIFVPTIGSFNVFVRQLFTSRALVNEVGTSGLTAEESNKLTLAVELMESDQFFDISTGLLHYYRKGTTVDIIPPKTVAGADVTTDVTITE